jgi:hypothetical protein
MTWPMPLPSWKTSAVRQGRYVSLGEVGYGLALNQPTIVRAEQIKIQGTYSAPGQSIWLIADRIIATNATIDVSGGNAATSYSSETHAQNGSQPGLPGTDANKDHLPPASDGFNGGSVTILCRSLEGGLTISANGGRGGDGLNGGGGAKGITGKMGDGLGPQGAVGYPGGPGGKAGDGGKAGNGGAEGFIYTGVAQNSCTLTTYLTPGNPGNPGQPGVPGDRGDGGPGGPYGTWAEDGEGSQPYYVVEGYGPVGQKGPPGLPGAVGKRGIAGSANVPNPQVVQGAPAISLFMDIDWLQDLLTEAEDDYAGEQLATATASLLFIAFAAGTERAQGNPVLHRPDTDPNVDIDSLDSFPGQAETSSLSAYADVWARAETLLEQIAHGLSYVGQTRDTVIRRNPQFLQSPLDQLSQYGKIISDRISTVSVIVENADTRFNQLTDCANMASSQSQTISGEIKSLTDQWNKSNAMLPQLDAMVRERAEDLENAQNSFRQAILAAANGGCAGFVDLLKITAAIVAVYQGFVEALPALAATADQVESGGQSLDNLSKIAKVLKPVAGDFKSIVDGYQTIKGFIDSDSKGALLVINQKDLADRVDDVLKAIDATPDAPAEAKSQLKTAVRDYLAAVKARNDAIVLMDNIATKIDADTVAVADLSRQEANFRDAAQAAVAPQQESLLTVLKALERSYLKQVRDFLWQADRAVDYFALRTYSPDPLLGADELAKLADAAGNVILSVQAEVNKLGAPERFPVDGDSGYSIRVDLSPVQQASLARGSLLLSLDPRSDGPKAYPYGCCVFADSVKVTVDGADQFTGRLTHLGACRFTKTPTEQIAFRLSPETRTITQENMDLGTGNQAGAESANGVAQYVGLSPFSDWLLEFDDLANSKWLDTAKFIIMEFTGTMRTVQA